MKFSTGRKGDIKQSQIIVYRINDVSLKEIRNKCRQTNEAHDLTKSEQNEKRIRADMHRRIKEKKGKIDRKLEI